MQGLSLDPKNWFKKSSIPDPNHPFNLAPKPKALRPPTLSQEPQPHIASGDWVLGFRVTGSRVIDGVLGSGVRGKVLKASVQDYKWQDSSRYSTNYLKDCVPSMRILF